MGIFLTFLLLSGGVEKNTSNPTKAFQYWGGQKPDKEVRVINGKYWESAHWTKEYILYLQLEASPLWRSEFIKQNNLQRDSVYSIPDDAPTWFKAKKDMKAWKGSGFDQGSIFLEDTVTGQVLIYDIQL